MKNLFFQELDPVVDINVIAGVLHVEQLRYFLWSDHNIFESLELLASIPHIVRSIKS